MGDARPFFAKDSAPGIPLNTAILATCRRVHDEALPVLYSENRFIVHYWDIGETWRLGEEATFPFDKLGLIKDLTLVAKAVADLSISKQVNIELGDDTSTTAALFGGFVRSVATIKGWRCAIELERRHADQDGESFLYKWSLRPAGDKASSFRPPEVM
ncbi:MAG: hypothetical protein Q9191_005818 [Dirinaria sp. TL-2023a]